MKCECGFTSGRVCNVMDVLFFLGMNKKDGRRRRRRRVPDFIRKTTICAFKSWVAVQGRGSSASNVLVKCSTCGIWTITMFCLAIAVRLDY